MKKPFAFLPFFVVLLCASRSFASGPVNPIYPPSSCIALVNVSLAENCSATIDISAFLTQSSIPADWTVQIDRTLPHGNGPWEPPVFGLSDVFDWHGYQVLDGAGQQVCTGEVRIRDGLAPTVTCADDVTVSSLFEIPTPAFLQDSLGIDHMFATALDACGGQVTIAYTTHYQALFCDSLYKGIISRTWRATDQSGNTASCVQTIHLLDPQVEDVIFPTDTLGSCPGNGVAPEITGLPYVVVHNRVVASQNAFASRLGIWHVDSLDMSCGSIIYRKWYILDWCRQLTVEHTQQVTISSPQASILNCPVLVTVDAAADNTCHGLTQLPDFEVEQPCSAITSAVAFWTDGPDSITTSLLTPSNLLGGGMSPIVTLDSLLAFPIGANTVWYQVTDACGNIGTCSFQLHVNDTTDVCENITSNAVVLARTEISQPIDEAEINLSAPAVPLNLTATTDETGTVLFGPLDDGITFGVGGYKNNDHANGVTTADLIVISRHILGIEPLGSPYKMIAADANRSGSITTFDLVTIRSLILGIVDSFPNNTSWRFVPADLVFPNPSNPFQGPLSLPTYTTPLLAPVELIGIKIGDVNNTADPLNLTTIDERDLRTLSFEVPDKQVQEGEEFIATLNADMPAEGFQFTLHSDELDIQEVLPGAGMRAEQFALFPSKNALAVACETRGRASFALRMKSRRSGSLQNLLRLDSDITRAEAYLPTEGGMESARVALRFVPTSDDFQVFQNQPNPAGGYTDIPFSLPRDSEFTLTILDAAGRSVYSTSGQGKKGLQTLHVDLSGIESGVLYYQVRTKEHCGVRKLIKS
ncbi:MAG: T9SS type A sorting domain-containing protein [Saprospiraceae bacterium]|nr:T9SS type A sorting domain-containing protein [Saprospiraceae bacterium]